MLESFSLVVSMLSDGCQSSPAMTREDTSSKTVSYKSRSSNLNCFLTLIFTTTLVTAVYFLNKSEQGLGDPSDQFILKNIPKVYTKLEGVDPEERDVFQGFRTSFLPAEEYVVEERPFNKREVHKRDVKRYLDKRHFGKHPARIKRTDHHTSTTKLYVQDIPLENNDEETQSLEFERSDSEQHYDDDENTESAHSQETHDDHGPLDDVVEQVRRQPELEEGEMGSSALVYKPSQSYSGIHAFWKGEGDKATIRHTQASIMRQYMDAGADPCHDFYQYACGNWAPVNPIPADKAGYDTFEILRENLDMVLKDLLEFKDYEDVVSVYPGPNLDIEETFVGSHSTQKKYDIVNTIYQENYTFYPDSFNSRELSNVNGKPSQIINRLRRYLDDKPSHLYNLANTMKRKPHHSKIKYKIYKKQINRNEYRKKFRSLKPKTRSLPRNIESIRVGRRLQMFTKDNRKRKGREVAHNTVKAELKTLADLLDIDQQNDRKNDAAQKARFLFKSCMNYEILEKRGHQPLLDLLNQLGGWPILDHQWSNSNFDWLELMAKLRMYNNDILLSEWVGPDIKNSEEFVIQFDQTSLGLPTREYFLLASNKMYLEAYEAYLIKIALLLGGDPIHVKTNAKQLIEFENKLAKITSAPEDRRNVSELYRRMTLAELEDLVPEVQWRRYLCLVMNRTVKSDETVVLFALNYVQHLVKLIAETEPNVLANYLLWRFVRHRVNNLDDRFQTAKQQFYYILFGREQAPSRWKNCVSQVNSNMGMALGSLFVRKYFDEISKNDTLHMTKELQQAFKELLHTIGWIDENTKSLAAQKVESMMLRIGYPDFILDKKQLDERYKEVKIHPDKYFENILNILQHLTKVEQSRIGQPVNKTLWNTAPAVVNAYYSRNKNQIMFPAGILQPPFYHRHFPRSLNYGGIGVVIGHEITHGFDDKGRLFDCEGNLHRWWSDNSIAAFHKRAQCLINQYGQYVVPEVNMKLDGINTQGENIADNGGVKQAFRAYTQWLQKNGDEGETMPGMNHTHKQLFFLNFAQVWCGAMRPEAMRNKLKTAVHSPGRFRVIGTLSNSEDFAREFNCPLGSQMNPKQKCTVW